MSSHKNVFSIIVNLEHNSLLSRYIPAPYIVKIDKAGTLGRVRAQATHITVPTFDIIIDESVTQKIIQLCDALSLKVIEEKFTSKKRNQNTLAKVILIPEVKSLLLKYYDRISNELFSYLSAQGIPTVLEIERKVRLERLKIVAAKQSLKPILRFDKTHTGVKYSLKLDNGTNEPWSPKSKDVHILTNHNTWIIADYVMYRVNEINGNKLKPFLKSDHIFIKNDMVITYFEKFIIEVARKCEIEAVGFEISQRNTIKESRLVPTYDFIDDQLKLDIVFYYDEVHFSYGSIAENRTQLHISDDKNISISQIKRDRDAENEWVKLLVANGLKKERSLKFGLPSSCDSFALVSFLSRNKEKLSKEGFKVISPKIDNKRISLEGYSIVITSSANQDWFDLGALINVGDETIQFSALIEHIREGNRYYNLRNGDTFIIPQLWITKYKDIAKYAVVDGPNVKMRKSQYAMLEEVEELSYTVNKSVIAKETIRYQQSPNLNAVLRPYQQAGVNWLITHQTNGLGACLADDMGLGKTLQTIAVLSFTKDNLKKSTIHKEAGQMTLFATEMESEISPLRALIILPSSLVFNWKSEIKKFNPSLHVLEFVGSRRKEKIDSLDKFDIVLTTYHTILRDVALLRSIKWEYIILDESQMIKNKESKMFKSINELPAVNRLSLSGTPIENSLSDLWSQMQFINPDMLGSFAFFKKQFLTPIEKYQDEDALADLAKMIKPYILRRTKEEVATDLPALTEQISYIDMEKSQKEIYDKVKNATRNYLLGLDDSDRTYKFHVFAALTKLRQLANDPKMVDAEYNDGSKKKEHILSKLEELRKSGHKVLIFSAFTKLLDIFKSEYDDRDWSYTSLTGKDSQKQRKESVDRFQNDEKISTFFISLKAGGTGLNLTAADYVFILDPWWNPFAEKQAIARAHRIGQHKPVTVIRFITRETIEEKIIKLQDKKKTLSDNIIHFNEEKLDLGKADFDYLIS